LKIRSGDQGDADKQDVDDGQGDQEMPPRRIKLVKRYRGMVKSQPHEEIDIEAHFENKPEAAVIPALERLCHGQNHGRD